MNKLTERLFEIQRRKQEIRSQVEGNAEGINLDSLETELRNLDTEYTDIEKRMRFADGITVPKPEEDNNMNNNELGVSSPEYRSAWLKRLQRKDLTEAEQRSISSVNVAGAIPTQTSEQILSKVKQVAPILNEITLLHVAGNVNFVVEGDNADAELHTENGETTPATDITITVSLAGYEIVKTVRISQTVQTMSINAFEGWLTDMLSEKIGRKIEFYSINGTGSNQPKGVDYAATWTDTSNAVAFAAANPTYAELCELVGYLPGGYARNAKFLMNHKTFWSKIQAIRDDAKASIVSKDGETYRIMGFPALFSDYVNDGDIFLGDFKKVVANLAQDITISSSTDSGFIYNSIDYRGVAIYDSDIAISEAFVKGAQTLTAGA